MSFTSNRSIARPGSRAVTGAAGAPVAQARPRPVLAPCLPPVAVPRIAYPLASLTPRALVNLLVGIFARQELLCAIVQRRDAFRVGAGLVDQLRAALGSGAGASAAMLDELLFWGQGQMRGLWPAYGMLLFTGFPTTCTVHQRAAYQALADRLVARARTKRWAKATLPRVYSERYAARTWLNSLGLTGPEYRHLRELLLRPLAGDSAFRLSWQREACHTRRMQERAARAAYAHECAFIPL